jgi:hypothetical protein
LIEEMNKVRHVNYPSRAAPGRAIVSRRPGVTIGKKARKKRIFRFVYIAIASMFLIV